MARSFTRRQAIALAGAAGTAAALGGCNATNPPPTSPFLIGPYDTGEIILGVDDGTAAMPQPLTDSDIPVPFSAYNYVCSDGQTVTRGLPSTVQAAVYYPQPKSSQGSGVNIASGPFPVLIFAHALRDQAFACLDPGLTITTDFERAGEILKHVASYGCVAVSPDLSFLPGDSIDGLTVTQAFSLRATILVALHGYLAKLNSSLFQGQLDLSRVLFAGHSTGCGASLMASQTLAAQDGVTPLAYGLLGPYFARQVPPPVIGPSFTNVVVIHGTLDMLSGPDSVTAYQAAGAPKTLVTIPGANHFGYTDLCDFSNACPAADDTTGTISRTGQQQTAAAYLAAMLRLYAQGDQTARPYLDGREPVQGLEIWGVQNVQVDQVGVYQLQNGPPN